MAKGLQNTSSTDPRRFDRELNEDVNDFHLPPDSWTKARNANNNSVTGDLGKLGNEPSNLFCTKAPYPIIGVIHITADRWAIYSTDDTDSEIGIYEEGSCSYTTVVNDRCLGFKRTNLIKGVSKKTSECGYQLYWEDGRLNPSRTLDLENIPWKETCVDENGTDIATAPAGYTPQGCITCTPIEPKQLDCEKIRLAALVKPACLKVQKGVSGGTLPNGTYFATAAYTIAGQKITDYFTISNQQPLFEHDNVAGSIDILIENVDTNFDEMEVVIVYIVNQQTVARRLGIYSTRQNLITVDNIEATLVTIPIEQIPIRNIIADSADDMYRVNDYLLRVGPSSKFDFNYQPLANQIVTKWVSVEYPADYYQKGGSNAGHLRDEVYPYFIRWIFNTGDKSASYHIPGRPAVTYAPNGIKENALYSDLDTLAGDDQLFETINTATQDGPTTNIPLPDGGVQIAEGYMGYWESTERYPDEQPDVWNASSQTWFSPINVPYPGTDINPNGDYDLCGERIRHHKFPDNFINFTNSNTAHFTASSPNFGGNPAIRILGVKFENIRPPVDNQGNVISNIVGYEILRGSRQGNRSIIAKGIINNMGLYNIPDAVTPRKGAYQNYPYNDRNPDPFLTVGETRFKLCIFGITGGEELVSTNNPVGPGDLLQDFSKRLYTFHSPETTFDKPFLSGKELKVYGELRGTVTGKFEFSEKHPRFKLVSNTAFIVSAIAGLGVASIAMNGKRNLRKINPTRANITTSGLIVGPSSGLLGWSDAASTWGSVIAASISQQAYETLYATLKGISDAAFAPLLANLAGATTELIDNILDNASLKNAFASSPWTTAYEMQEEVEDTTFANIPPLLRLLQGVPTFLYFWSEGTDKTLSVIRALLSYKDYALKYNSHCLYDQFIAPPSPGNRRKTITEQQYLGPEFADFGENSVNGYRINNLYRNKTVAIEVESDIVYPGPDNTRQTVSTAASAGLLDQELYLFQPVVKNPTAKSFNTQSACYYVGYKQRLRNQYGQLEGIRQLPVSTCWHQKEDLSETSVLFNGDTYVGKYSEKNTFFYFYDWLYDQLDGYEFDYLSRKMMPYPRYWLDSREFDANDFTTGLINNLSSLNNPALWGPALPSNFFNLDGYTCTPLGVFSNANFAVKYSYFYLFNSGIREFFVESEINVSLRDWGSLDSEKHYPLLDPKSLFDTSIIKSGNYYKYDKSLSVSKGFVNYVSWGSLQPRDYDPNLAETCYTYTPNTVIYSLPSNEEAKKDGWLFYLANNYKIFGSKITCIKSVNKSGALIFFENQSPVQFYGVDQLQTDGGTKLTIGDGGLFEQPLQNLTNADRPYEYGSCQNRLSVINTPTGVYWISQNQGKIFQYAGSLKEISMQDLKWWFASYLPYKLTEEYPNFSLTDNPVIGIGCQAIYDNENSIIYFTKKDYVTKPLPDGTVLEYIPGTNQFYVKINGVNTVTIELGDPIYFEDASWTISYDPKVGSWISWHDWHPDLLIPGKNTFMSVKNQNATVPAHQNGIWVHNYRCDSYCNFYDVDYPFEVEYMVHTVQTVNTLRNVEYIMEVYKYAPNCYDRFHALDFNFDEAVVYNTEQCSGLLKLNLKPKNNPVLMLNYPQVNFQDIDIIYSKEEQKYRFNQFWDITASRGEFPINSPYPPPTPNVGTFAERMMWNTAANGYVRELNPNNLNYSKNPLERKKFRHYVTYVFLRRKVSGDKKMLVMLANNKNLYSPR